MKVDDIMREKMKVDDIMRNSINNIKDVEAHDGKLRNAIGYITIKDVDDIFSDKYIRFNCLEDIKKLHDAIEELIYLAGNKGL